MLRNYSITPQKHRRFPYNHQNCNLYWRLHIEIHTLLLTMPQKHGKCWEISASSIVFFISPFKCHEHYIVVVFSSVAYEQPKTDPCSKLLKYYSIEHTWKHKQFAKHDKKMNNNKIIMTKKMQCVEKNLWHKKCTQLKENNF